MENQNNTRVEVRIFAVEELLSDFDNRNVYISSKIASDKKLTYLSVLKQALFAGDVNSFTQSLERHSCLTADALNVSKAAETLAYNEFKRYYIRGTCRTAIATNASLRICRVRASKNPSKDAEQRIGETLNPGIMLSVARKIPGTSIEDTDGSELRILRPNSSLCVEILYTTETTVILNNKGEHHE